MADRLLVSTRKGLFAVARSAAGWRVESKSFVGENATLALADPTSGGWYVALNLGHFGVKLKFSPDAGATWEDRAAPTYPAGESVPAGDGKDPVPATLKLIWALEPDGRGGLWAGTAPGGLFHSADGGQTWTLNRGLWDRPERAKWMGGGYDQPGIHSVCVHPGNPDVVRIGISCGGVWHTVDGGAMWEPGTGMHADYMPPELRFDPAIQDPHRMTQCIGAPDHLWVQHHNGVFRSTDGAKTWAHVPAAAPSGFGFGVVVHPSDPLTAWFAPATKDECRVPVGGAVVASRTRDGGTTFDVLRSGLPQMDAYDLIFRHALAIDGTGRTLAMGSTTGGLWVSEDGGDKWAEVPARLPPVHAVAFAA